MNLQGEVAFITGAGRGIGRHIALDMARDGALVGLVARNEQQLWEVAREIKAVGGSALVAPADVTSRSSLEAAIQQVTEAFGTITIAINNAGVDRPFGPVEAVDPDLWWQAQEIHVRAAYIVMHKVIPAMRALGRGRIINVASSAAVLIGANCSSYCVGKATLVRLTEHVHAEIADAGLSAFAVHPGTIMTSMGLSAIADPDARKWAGPLVDHLTAVKDVDPIPGLQRVAKQVTELASGQYDALAGKYIDLDIDLDAHLAALALG
jgi:NAD(P)-dependent dehydrogenase (short-subunit alcohol dehydrogenase family)